MNFDPFFLPTQRPPDDRISPSSQESAFTVDVVNHFLSKDPNDIYRIRIQVERPPKPSTPKIYSVSWEKKSSLGALDRLPAEILHNVLGMLDFQSLYSVSRVSFRGNAMVESTFAFQDIICRTPETLMALRRLNLGGLYSITELYEAMCTQNCATCNEYGTFLFLLTCERCCWHCMRNDPAFRAILPNEASQLFGLSTSQVGKLPLMDPILGVYGIWNDAEPKCVLVSAKAAKELATEVHGSVDNLVQVMHEALQTWELVSKCRYYMGGDEALEGKTLGTFEISGSIPYDSFAGMGSIPFPSLSSDNDFADSYMCRGCEVADKRNDTGTLPLVELKPLVPEGSVSKQALLNLESRARLRKALLHHVKHCTGVHQLPPERGPLQLRTRTGHSQEDSNNTAT